MGSPLIDVSIMQSVVSGKEQQLLLQLQSPIVSSTVVGESACAAAGAANGTCAAATLRSLYVSFLEDMHYDPAGSAPSAAQVDEMATISARVSALCGDDDFDSGSGGGSSPAAVPPYAIATATRMAGTAYAHLCVASRVKVAHFIALIICMDDYSDPTVAAAEQARARARYLHDLTLFYSRLSDPEGYARRYPGRGPLHPALERMVRFLGSENCPLYGTHPRRHAVLVKSMLEYVEALLMEANLDARPGAAPVDLAGSVAAGGMRLAPAFWRNRSGVSEAFAHYIFMDDRTGTGPRRDAQEKEEEECRHRPAEADDDQLGRFYGALYAVMPELVCSIQYINDVLSLYKELQDGETSKTTIVLDARIHGVSLQDALAAYARFTAGSRKRMLSVLHHLGAHDMRATVDRFLQGYLYFHVVDARYRLHELLPSYQCC